MTSSVRILIIAFCFLLPTGSFAQPTVAYEPVTAGLSNPVDIVSAPGDTRLYIAQQNGLIRIWNGTALSTFANLGSLLTSPAGGEQGLLSVAFHPGYASNRYFFVWYTDVNGAVTLARYRRDVTNPDIADPASGQVLLRYAKPGSPYFTNHNGGKLNFGPDGMLYVGTGDGGNGGDPYNNAQNGNSLMGKMLRLNVNSFATSAPFYDIPADNPFLAPGDGILDEIYAIGLRNPWRWSFDRSTGDMWIADVGQGAWEEVNWLAAGSTSGVNYGWRCYEANHVYGSGCSPAVTDTIAPIFEYSHNNATGGYSITGGYVYRGAAYPELQGYYITTDYISTNLWLIKPNASGGFDVKQQTGMPNNISSFGEANDGSLYAVRRSTGTLYKVIATGVVPVTISNFTARAEQGYDLLTWNSSAQSATALYHIEYSRDGRSFYRAGTVQATNNNREQQYTFRYNNNETGNVFYRLAMETADGNIRFSNVLRLQKNAAGAVEVYPTVLQGNSLSITSKNPLDDIRLLNISGAVMYQKSMHRFTGSTTLNLPNLAKGLYILRLTGDGSFIHQKIIVQ